MKKINLIAVVLAAVMAAVFSGCSSDIIGESSDVFLRQSTTAVSNLKATAYEGAIVLTWSYNADLAGGFRITRTADGAEKIIANNICETNTGENYYVDYYGDTNQLEDGKTYTYTVYTLPSSSSAVIDKSASASASAAAIIKRPSRKLEQWDESEITAKWKKYDDDENSKEIWVVVTRPDSYAYGYSATLTVEYEYEYRHYDNASYVWKTATDSTTIDIVYQGLDSTKKDGKDGTAKDYYKIVKGNSWTEILNYTLSATKSLKSTSCSLLGFYEESDETNVKAEEDKDTGEVLASYVWINPDADNNENPVYCSKEYVIFYKDNTWEDKLDGRLKNSAFSKRTAGSGTYTGNPMKDGTVSTTVKKICYGVANLNLVTEEEFFRLVSTESLIENSEGALKESNFQGSATISDNATKLIGKTYKDEDFVYTRDK